MAGSPTKDLFSNQAELYAKYRPDYPPGLYGYILDKVAVKEKAWDCGTGNGQAALYLSQFFPKVFATDISEKQLANAPVREGVYYQLCPADKTPFEDNSFDLITVAQAYHWFPFESFAREVYRTGKPGSILAVWCYSLPQTEHEAVNACFNRFYREETGAYWDKERKYIEQELKTVSFPYEEIQVDQKFFIEKSWSRNDVAGYARTWSAVQNYLRVNQTDPVIMLEEELKKIWDENSLLHFRFPIYLRMGKIIK